MSTSGKDSYHHGDLRAALLKAALELLETGSELSLREVARRAGVSSAAPYRHFADKRALESALAAEGFRELGRELSQAGVIPRTVSDIAELGVRYVEFALKRPALFCLMFGNACDDSNDERVRAAAEVRGLVSTALASVFPGADASALSTAGWSLVHGLAFLHLDGKLGTGTRQEVAARVRSSIEAIFSGGRTAVGRGKPASTRTR
ncbi:TetR/AcrR family transcriptional regulator [Myxococcus sp. MISCRS1]|uniref:TetR/AcrR family transcriptional regulator n=1 Tax=Myxococcus TaxID=32 RepID=UPI0022712194|nr:TetR/AcrR family transcriptional regulator [Myxococcus sp. MISCRS1]MCY1000001.1 TetR/AcrR family transcriptional regulator [Myxococcus sp. MISCRS1]